MSGDKICKGIFHTKTGNSSSVRSIVSLSTLILFVCFWELLKFQYLRHKVYTFFIYKSLLFLLWDRFRQYLPRTTGILPSIMLGR